MNSEEKNIYIARFLSGELTESEVQEFLLWLDADPEHQELLESATAIWETTGLPIETNTLKSWNKVQQKIKPSRNYGFMLRAAMILVLIGFSLWFFQSKSTVESYQVIYESLAGQNMTVFLEDSSQVVLGSESKLVVQYPWENSRTMDFSGNGYFKVTSDQKRPFKINTEAGEVRVLGTAFFVNTRKEAGENLIAVQEGKVRFTEKNDLRQVDIPIGFALSSASEIDEDLIPIDQLDSYWMDHKLTYAKIAVKTVFDDLEKLYDCKIKVDNPQIYNCEFSGKFQDNELNEILDVIAFALDLNIDKKTSNQFYIIGKGCTN